MIFGCAAGATAVSVTASPSIEVTKRLCWPGTACVCGTRGTRGTRHVRHARDPNFVRHTPETFSKKKLIVAIDFLKKSSKSELSSRFFACLKILQDLEGHRETCEVPIWRSCEFLSVTSRFVSKNYPRHSEIQLSRILGGGVKRSISIFSSVFWPKPTCTLLVADMTM